MVVDEVRQLRDALSKLKLDNEILRKRSAELKEKDRRSDRFTSFGKLPLELRCKIWDFALGVEEVFVVGMKHQPVGGGGHKWYNVQPEAGHSTSKIQIMNTCHKANT